MKNKLMIMGLISLCFFFASIGTIHGAELVSYRICGEAYDRACHEDIRGFSLNDQRVWLSVTLRDIRQGDRYNFIFVSPEGSIEYETDTHIAQRSHDVGTDGAFMLISGYNRPRGFHRAQLNYNNEILVDAPFSIGRIEDFRADVDGSTVTLWWTPFPGAGPYNGYDCLFRYGPLTGDYDLSVPVDASINGVPAGGVPNGEYHLALAARHGEALSAFSDDLMVTVYVPLGAIEGYVTDAETGLPVEGATVQAGNYTAITDDQGYYIIQDISEATYDISATAQGYHAGSHPGINIPGGQTIRRDFQLQPVLQPGAVQGHVTDASTGAAIAGATVQVGSYSGTTDSSGYYFIQGIPEGPYDITVTAQGYHSGTHAGYYIPAGQTLTRDFQLQTVVPPVTTGAIQGHVTDASTGAAIAGATVQVGSYSDTTDSSGYYFVQGIPEGPYDITVTAQGYHSGSHPGYYIPPGQIMTRDFQLQPESTPGPVTGSETITANGVSFVMVYIPAGEFMMGSPEGEGNSNEHPQHRVRITRAFRMGQTEVTQALWRAVMGSEPPELYFPGCDQCPVERVSWNDIQDFISRINSLTGRSFLLPTEAEWEYACRAGTTTAYSFGDDSSALGEYAWYQDNSNSQTHPVAEKRPNAWGLYDMHGNVWEWCQDYYDSGYYSRSPVDDPRNDTVSSYRVVRGGSWDGFPNFLRCAFRGWSEPGNRNNGVGLRLAQDQ